MKAIILAAGVGKRLWQVTQHRPKCLIEIGGQTLLHRYLMSLRSVGIHCADMVVGYKQEMIRAAVAANSCGVRVNFLVNEQFHRGSISSLWTARTALDDDVIVMDADVLFHQEILRRLVQSPWENALLMDETVKQTGEECMVVVECGRVIALTKTMPLHYFSRSGMPMHRMWSRRFRHMWISKPGRWSTRMRSWAFFATSQLGTRRSVDFPGLKSILWTM
jgi:choline kinase